MWIILGIGAIVTAGINMIKMLSDGETKYFRFTSMALTALTVCAFYSDGARRVVQDDFSGLMDIMPAMSKVLWTCVAASIIVNSISLFARKR